MEWRWIAVGYVTYLALVALACPAFRRARRSLLVAAGGGWVLTAVWAVMPAPPVPAAVPVLLPALVLIGGYWLSGLLFVAPDFRSERWLSAVDDRLLRRSGILARFRRAPGAVPELFELSYLLVYAAIPAGAVTLAVAGHLDQVDRFWTVVLLAEFACYGMLPWIQTRPPRVLEADGPAVVRGPLRRLNLALAERASIQANTIPSGHTAGAVAAALAVASVMPLAGSLFLLLAASITVATVTGRYHYSVDAVAGIVVGFMAIGVA